MIYETNYTVFEVDAECIVNTVNCDGFMGKGLAQEFALRYPILEKTYIEQCKAKEIQVGKVYFYKLKNKDIINFPTKFHYQYPSELMWIEEGLKYFRSKYKDWKITSIAFPLLGGSNGGLDKDAVTNLMHKYLQDLDIKVYICKSCEVGPNETKTLSELFKVSSRTFVNEIGINAKQANLIIENFPNIKWLADIRKIKGVGAVAYKKIYVYLRDKKYLDNVSLF